MVRRLARRNVIIGCGSMAGLFALAICALLGWWAAAAQPVDSLARARQLPVYPGASSVQVVGGSTGSGQGSTLTFETPVTIEQMFAYYDGALRKAGWQPVVGESDGGTGKYTEPEGSFEGIEFTGGFAGPGAGFPWFRIVRNPRPLFLQIDISEVQHGGVAWTHVSVELVGP